MTKKNFKKLVGLSSTLEQLFEISLPILNELDESQNAYNLGSKEISILSIDNKNWNNMKSIFSKINDIEFSFDKTNTEAKKKSYPNTPC